jgi:glycerate kinase
MIPIKNILVAPNSFKECADAVKVSDLFNKYLDKSIFHVIQKPISDGGDGFLDVCKFYFPLDVINYKISTSYNKEIIDCKIGLDRKGKTIYIESAEILGLKKIPVSKRHPLILSSKGMGDLLKMIISDIENSRINVEKIVIGIGGTGTMDMGMGMCSRFGLKIFDTYENELEVVPENFPRVNKFDIPRVEFPLVAEAVLDVNNPLLGITGSALIYGKQKGATGGEIKVIELGWGKLINLFEKNKLLDLSNRLPGAGGGLAVGFKILLDTLEVNSSDFIKKSININNLKPLPDIVITGEGAFDEQSLMGKGAGIIISMFEEMNIPIVLCCGRIGTKISEKLSMNVFPIELGKHYDSVDESIHNFEESIKYACDEIAGMTDILTKIS